MVAPPVRNTRGCSPFALLGCGCGLLAAIGILIVFFILSVYWFNERRDPRWNRAAFAECQQNLLSLRHAIESYESDYHKLPASLDELRASYLDRPSRTRCPLEILGHGDVYTYSATAKRPHDALVTCRNHGQGVLVLERGGSLRLPKVLPKGR